MPSRSRACLVASCQDAPVEPTVEPGLDAAPVFKVEKTLDRFVLPLAGTETYIDCLGETLLWYGTVDIIWSEWTTPSGNWIASWKIDYFDTPELTWLQGETSNEIWYITKAENQGTGWITKDKGPQFIQHYQSNEWYENDDGDRLHIRIVGRFMYDADGSPRMERHEWWGHCHPA